MRQLLFAALALTLHAAVPDCLPPKTTVVVGINIRSLLQSPLLKDAPQADAMAAPYLAGTPLAGLNPVKDLDDLTIASTGDGEKAPALLVLRGRFPSGIAAGKIQKDPKTPTSSYALLDANTLIAGDEELVKAALNSHGPSSLAPALRERIAALEGRYDFWIVGEVPKGIHSTAAPSPEMEAIDRFDIGASLRTGLDLAAQIHVRTPKDAEKLMQTMKLLEMMIAMQPKTGNAQSKVDLRSSENTISLSLFIPEEELKKAVEAQKGKWMSTAMPEPKPQPTPVSTVKNDTGDTVTVTLPRK
jgi:hypothetical protein